ncbi:MAG: SemiSWEET transporter [Candidatus Omnitrophota bacterium]
MLWKIVGLTAALLTTFSFVPQIIKVRRSRSVKDVSLITLVQFSAGVFLWALYGIFLRDVIIISANCVTLVTLCILLSLYFKYSKMEKPDEA